MYEEQIIGEIILGLLFFIPFAIIAVIIIRWIVIAVLNNIVERTSTRYKKILELNCEYELKFDSVLRKKYKYSKDIKSKQQYDSFNFDNFLREIISETDIDYWTGLHNRTQSNHTLYLQYLLDISDLSDLQDKKHSKMYCKYESRLCEKVQLKRPVTELIIECHINYTSPKGRNSYNQCHIYEYDDILQCYKDIEHEKERRQTKEYQRSIMTQSLRYDIMKRDGFRCVLCGRNTEEDGVKLHVDHIIPVSKGGKTVESNLRTLCEDCNMGKSDKYDSNGVN